jgi:hypothetical protein
MLDKRALVEEAHRRIGGVAKMVRESFEPQQRFILDSAKFQSACCSRRAGKTEGLAIKLLRSAKRHDRTNALYLALTRGSAKRILWPTLKQRNSDYSLGGSANEADLSMRFENGSTIYLAGAVDAAAVERLRGMAFKLCVLDEAQGYGRLLEPLIDDVLMPTLIDYDGSLVLAGTPGPAPIGYYYESTRSDRYSKHRWTMAENPWILAKSKKTFAQHLAAELERRGVTSDDPGIQRELFGAWVVDSDALVIAYDAQRNGYAELPNAQRWQYVIGGDIGLRDSDALAVLGFCEGSPNTWLVEESVHGSQIIDELEQDLIRLYRKYDPISVVFDAGALGAKIVETMKAHTLIPIEAAVKLGKLGHIADLNSALRKGQFLARSDSRFALDASVLEWDRSNPEKPAISDTHHSDIIDAVIYGYTKSLGYLERFTEVKKVKTLQEQLDAEDEADIACMREARFDQGIASDLAQWRIPEA